MFVCLFLDYSGVLLFSSDFFFWCMLPSSLGVFDNSDDIRVVLFFSSLFLLLFVSVCASVVLNISLMTIGIALLVYSTKENNIFTAQGQDVMKNNT